MREHVTSNPNPASHQHACIHHWGSGVVDWSFAGINTNTTTHPTDDGPKTRA